MVTDFLEAEHDKRHRKTFQCFDHPLENTSENSNRKNQKYSVIESPEFKPQFSEIFEPSSSFLLDKNQFKTNEPENIIRLPSTYLHNTKVSNSFSSLDNYHKTSSHHQL